MIKVYVLPGFLSSALSETPDNNLIWIDEFKLLKGAFKRLTLAPNGIDPKAEVGSEMRASGVVNNLCLALAHKLESRPDFDVTLHFYDWRRNIVGLGESLAMFIRGETRSSDTVYIVGHSMGGLVARFAWRALKLTGEEARVKRIVTLGTPHRGSYSPANCLLGADPYTIELTNRARGFEFHEFRFQGKWFRVPLDAIRVCATWPSLYQMLPLQDEFASEVDPLSAELMTITGYPPSLPIDGIHLNHARTVFQPLLQSADTRPPWPVMVTVAGTGVRTPVKLLEGLSTAGKRDPRKGLIVGLSDTGGDGAVHQHSAFLPISQRILLTSDHVGLASHPTVLKNIITWLVVGGEQEEPPPVVSMKSKRPVFDGPVEMGPVPFDGAAKVVAEPPSVAGWQLPLPARPAAVRDDGIDVPEPEPRGANRPRGRGGR